LHQYTQFLGTWVSFSFIPVTVQYTCPRQSLIRASGAFLSYLTLCKACLCEVTPVVHIEKDHDNMHIHVKDNHSCVESYLPEGCHQNKKGGTETTCTKFLHTKGFRNKLNGLQALCPLLHCLESSLISDGIRSDTSVLLSLLLSTSFFFFFFFI